MAFIRSWQTVILNTSLKLRTYLNLRMLFQTSLNEGSLPGDWRIGNISPIHKKGPKTDAGNYRPVCLTSIICKIMESFIRDKVLRHMRENDLLSEHQHGFLPGRSTITQLLEAMDYWTEALDNGNDIDIIYLDFQKAFWLRASSETTEETEKLQYRWKGLQMAWKLLVKQKAESPSKQLTLQLVQMY